MNTNLLSTAAYHLSLGHSLVPIDERKRPHHAALVSTGYHRPGHNRRTGEIEQKSTWKRLQHEVPDITEVERWLRCGAGLGVVTGRISGLVIIDVDMGEGVNRFQAWGLGDHAHVRSPSGGLHWYVRWPGWAVQTLQSQTNSNLEAVKGIDIRGDGGYAIIPPTTFGKRGYEQLRDAGARDDAALLPPDVQALLGLLSPPGNAPSAVSRTGYAAPGTPPRRYAPVSREQEADMPMAEVLVNRALSRVQQGDSRNPAGMWLALQLRDNGFTPDDSLRVMAAYVRQVPGVNLKGEASAYTMREAEHSLDQAFSRPARQPWRRAAATLGDRVQAVWNAASAAQRSEFLRCACGMRSGRQEMLSTLRKLDAPGVLQAETAFRAAQERQEVTPGLNALMALLTQLEGGKTR